MSSRPLQSKRRSSAPKSSAHIQGSIVARGRSIGRISIADLVRDISALLAMTVVSPDYNKDYSTIHLALEYVRETLPRLEELNGSLNVQNLHGIVARMTREINYHSNRTRFQKTLREKNHQDMIASLTESIWREFNYIVNTNTERKLRDILMLFVNVSMRMTPRAPRDCFGRDELVKQVVNFALGFKPIALIGTGGIGKTHVALAVFHHSDIKKQFGENRRFIHCNRFLASPAHFLAQLSMIVGAGVRNPEDLVPLRPFFNSNEMFIVIDEVESILDPNQPDAQQFYSVLEELCRFRKLSICLTSRISTVPAECKILEIPTLSKKAACDLFYSVYINNGKKSRIINDLVGRLDFHPLFITLLATTASRNAWDYGKLAEEWNRQQVKLLQTGGSRCLATTIESSLASPTFQGLGPYAHDLLSIVAFFPQGINEKHSTRLIPRIPGSRNSILDAFVRLSLTDRRRGFITMLTPIRGYLNSKYSQPSPLLCRTIYSYIIKLLDDIRFDQKKWILLENLNIQHLLDELIRIYPDNNKIQCTRSHFIKYLASHSPQKALLQFKIKDLPNDHQFKRECLDQLSELSKKLNHRRGRVSTFRGCCCQ